MYSQKIPTYFDCFRIIDLINIFPLFFRDLYRHSDFRAEIVQDCPCPYFLYNVFIFLGMKCFETQRVFQVTERSFLIPSQMVQVLEIIEVEIKLRKICDQVFVTAI